MALTRHKVASIIAAGVNNTKTLANKKAAKWAEPMTKEMDEEEEEEEE